MSEENGEVLLTLRSSRKGYLVEYACAIFVLGALGLLYSQGKIPITPIKVLGFGVGFFAIASAEGNRWLTKYKISDTKITIIKGLIKQDRKHVYFHPLGFVPDLNVKQGRISRMLGIGTVYLKAGGKENTFEIRNISSPHKILQMIEDLIDANKSHMGLPVEEKKK